jgi:purine-binding chemotaxis protein CheW
VITAEPTDNSPPASYDALLVRMNGEIYALPSQSVREVMRYRDYTPVPGAPPMLPGILNQRGTIVPIVNLYPLLGLESPPVTRATRLVIMAHNDVDLALLLEAVLDLTTIVITTIEPIPVALDPVRARFLRGVVQHDEQVIALIDLDELIATLRNLE